MSKIKAIEAYGIINKEGQFWTHKTFNTILEAENYMELFWEGIKNPPDMSFHKVIPVLISPIITKSKKI